MKAWIAAAFGVVFLTSATVHFRSDLPRSSTQLFSLVYDPAYTAKFTPRVTLTTNAGGTAVIGANLQQLRVPANGAAASTNSAPILDISHNGGMTWIGGGTLVLPQGITLSSVREESLAPAGNGLNRTTFWRVLSLYGVADSESIAEANRMLDAVLPRGQEESIDPEDKFTHSAAVTFYRLHSAQLPTPLRERARWDIVNRVRAIERTYYPARRTNFNMGHTNFALMYLEAFVLGSEIIGDQASQERAYEAFHEFCDYTLHNGFTEFNATNYSKIDLHCLSCLATASTDRQVRRRAAAFAEFLWLDTAIHYWPSSGWLTGANARTYNYVGGLGGGVALVRPFFAAQDDPARLVLGEKKHSPGRFWQSHGGESGWIRSFDYEPPSYIAQIAREKQPTIYRGLWIAPEPDNFRRGFEGNGFQKTAHGEFGHQYGKDRYTYIEPAYALGTGGAHYASQDRMLVADIASHKDLTSISSQINTRLPLDAKEEFLNFLGNNRHIPTHSATVQDRNRAMILYSMELPPKSKGVNIVAPLLLLPANVDRILVNDRPADSEPGLHPLSAGDTLYLEEGDVYASLRFIETGEGFAGYRPTYHYRLDGRYQLEPKGNRDERLRTFQVGAMSCILYSGSRKRLLEKNIRAGFVVEMGTRKDYTTLAEFRRHIQTSTLISQSYQEGIWDVRYRSGDREISLRNDLIRHAVLDKRVDGIRVEPSVHVSSFSELKDGVLTVRWKGQVHTIDLRRNAGAVSNQTTPVVR